MLSLIRLSSLSDVLCLSRMAVNAYIDRTVADHGMARCDLQCASPPAAPKRLAENYILEGTKGASIQYTLDGTVPTSAATKYAGEIKIEQTTTVNGIAIASGGAASTVTSGTYTLTSGPVTESVLYSLGASSTDGTYPSQLIQGRDGNIYVVAGERRLWQGRDPQDNARGCRNSCIRSKAATTSAPQPRIRMVPTRPR